MALPMGVALWVFGVTFSLILPFKSSLLSILVSIIVLVCVYYKLFGNKESNSFGKKRVTKLAIWFIIYGAVSVLITSHNAVNTSPDSFAYLVYGNYIAEFGELNKSLPFIERISVPAVLSAAGILKVDYLAGIFPLISLCFLAIFGWFIWKVMNYLGKKQLESIIMSILAVLLLGTSYNYVYHSFYIGTNLFASIYFSIAFLSMFMYFYEKKQHWITISFASLAVFSLTRPEAVAFSFIILSLYLWQIKTKREWLSYIIPFVLLTYPWHMYIISYQGLLARSSIEKIFSFFVIFVTTIIIIYKWNYFQKIKKYIAQVVLSFLLGGTIIFAWINQQIAANNIRVFAQLILKTGRWGIMPAVFILLIVFFLFFCRTTRVRILIYGILDYILLLFVTFIRFGHFYTIVPDWFCSSNRLLLHFLPVVVAYIIISLSQVVKPNYR